MPRKTLFGFLLVTALFLLDACHPRPIEELALADLAVKAAQKVKADSLAPDQFRKAENFYLRAKKDYAEGYFESSKKFAEQARVMAEQAEYQALLKQTQLKGRPSEDDVLSPQREGMPIGGMGRP